MKNYSHIITCICCLTLTACEVEFDFNGLDDAPLFLLDGNIGITTADQETGSLGMYLYAVPSAAGERTFSEDARCTLKIYINSEPAEIKDYITIEPFYGYITGNYPVKPVDEILVTAESDGFPTASARTVIPQAPPVADVSCTMEGDNLKIRFSIEDNEGTDDAYAFCFRQTVSYNVPSDNDPGSSLDLSFGNPEESSFSDTGPFDISWDDGWRYYGISDDSFSGGRREFEVTAPYKSPSGYGTPYFRIEVQRISPERLRYEIACRDKRTNLLGFIGLAPVTFAYTNVSGGSGCISSYNSGGTGWIPIPYE